MANDFYKNQVERKSVSQSPVQGPDMSEGYKDASRRATSLANAMDSLVHMGKGLTNWGDKVAAEKTAAAKEKGAAEGAAGIENSQTSSDFWSGDAQTEAYNRTRGQNAVRELPQYIQDKSAQYYLEDQKTKGKGEYQVEWDELPNETRETYTRKAADNFFKEKGLIGSPYEQSARNYGNELYGKTTEFINSKALELTNAKKEANIQESSMEKITTFGDPKSIDEQVGLSMNEWQLSMGDAAGVKTKTAVMQGVLKSVMQPIPDMRALDYLKSPEGKKRFGDLEGFDKAQRMAEKHSRAYIAADVQMNFKQLEAGFYTQVNSDTFETEKDVVDYLNEMPTKYVDEKEKYRLKNIAMKQIGRNAAVENITEALSVKNYGVVNSAKEEVRSDAWEKYVVGKGEPLEAIINYQGNPDIPADKDPTLVKKNNIFKWIQDGNNVPQYVKETLNTELMPTFEKGDPMQARIATSQQVARTLKQSGVSKLYTTETQASMAVYAKIHGDISLSTPKEKAATYNKYIENNRRSALTGRSPVADIQADLSKPEYVEKLQDFAKQGGGDTTLDSSVPSDLQPLFSFRNNTDTDPNGYAMKSLSGNYAIYRHIGMKHEEADRKAKNDFLMDNQWVDFKSKAVYVPKEYGPDFVNQGMAFLKGKGILNEIAKNKGIEEQDMDILKTRITIEPSYDYASSKKLSVFYEGQDTSYTMSYKEFSTFNGTATAEELTGFEKSNEAKRADSKWIKQQKLKQQLQFSIDEMIHGLK